MLIFCNFALNEAIDSQINDSFYGSRSSYDYDVIYYWYALLWRFVGRFFICSEGGNLRNGESKTTNSCSNPTISEKSCCSDQQLIIEGQDDLKQDFTQLTFEQQIFVASFTYSYISIFEGSQSKVIPFSDHSPPFIRQDLQVLYQTFIIWFIRQFRFYPGLKPYDTSLG